MTRKLSTFQISDRGLSKQKVLLTAFKKDAECAETNEQSIFRFLRFLVFEIVCHFCTENWKFSMNFLCTIYHNSKNKNLICGFSFNSALWASFMKIRLLPRVGGGRPVYPPPPIPSSKGGQNVLKKCAMFWNVQKYFSDFFVQQNFYFKFQEIRDFWEPDSETLTSDTPITCWPGGFNPKPPGDGTLHETGV